MKPPKRVAVSRSSFEWEHEALEFLRAHLPDREPWRAWANFEFIYDEGPVGEMDLLVLTTACRKRRCQATTAISGVAG